MATQCRKKFINILIIFCICWFLIKLVLRCVHISLNPFAVLFTQTSFGGSAWHPPNGVWVKKTAKGLSDIYATQYQPNHKPTNAKEYVILMNFSRHFSMGNYFTNKTITIRRTSNTSAEWPVWHSGGIDRKLTGNTVSIKSKSFETFISFIAVRIFLWGWYFNQDCIHFPQF